MVVVDVDVVDVVLVVDVVEVVVVGGTVVVVVVVDVVVVGSGAIPTTMITSDPRSTSVPARILCSVTRPSLTAGNGLPTTVLPFILRGVNLYGIDSVQTPIERRREVWQRIASDLRPAGLDTIGHDIGLDELDDVLTGILDGKAVGRAVVDLKRS